jgi:hypothetical protein
MTLPIAESRRMWNTCCTQGIKKSNAEQMQEERAPTTKRLDEGVREKKVLSPVARTIKCRVGWICADRIQGRDSVKNEE